MLPRQVAVDNVNLTNLKVLKSARLFPDAKEIEIMMSLPEDLERLE